MRVVKFLGSVTFAILLILACTLCVIVGTVIEAKTGSHKAASRWIYSHPLFLMVLWGFFVNILFATLKRAPFKKRHIPFLITHVGLLMVISGTLLKISFGLQGTLTLKEGTKTKWVVLDDTWALSIQKKGDPNWHQIPLKRDFWGHLKTHYELEGLAIDIRGLAPHGEEKVETWIKDNYLTIRGHPPIPLNQAVKVGDRTLLAAENPETIKQQLTSLPALIFLNEPSGLTILEIAETGEVKEPHLYAYDEGRLGYSSAIILNDKELETPLTRQFIPKPPPLKAEEERPLLALSLNDEKIALAFNSPLPTGALNGSYLLRFEPARAPLPFELRLKTATATFYPNTSQPASYSASLLAGSEKITLKMNQVWESPEGIRFYLANLTPLDETKVKQVRLVVNHDPFKSFLTYPGALILAIGILLLFSRKIH